jgi:hypothetical protein
MPGNVLDLKAKKGAMNDADGVKTIRVIRVIRWQILLRAPGVSWTPFAQPSSFTARKRKALMITETELKLIAAPAMIGLNNTPKNG